MLNKVEVLDLFRQYIPDTIDIVWVDPDTYIDRALEHPFIQAQISVGVYDEENIYEDFLSPACSFSQFNRLELCYELMASHGDGVDDRLTRAYLTIMALHEAHHFHTKRVPSGVEEHGHSELECIAVTAANHPEMEALSQEFENASPVFQRVYARIAHLQKERVKG